MEHYNRYQHTRFGKIDDEWSQSPNRERKEMYHDNLRYYRERHHDPRNPSYPAPYSRNYAAEGQGLPRNADIRYTDAAHHSLKREELSQLREQQTGPHKGKGPRAYKKTDDRILEDINDRMCDNPYLDASNIEIRVKDGDVILNGAVEDRDAKRLAADIAEDVSGVNNVENRLRVEMKGI